MKHRWTKDEDAKLATVVATGVSARNAVPLFDGAFTRSALIARAGRIGLKFFGDSVGVESRATAARQPTRLGGALAFTPLKKQGSGARSGPVAPKLRIRRDEPAPIGPENDLPAKGCKWIHGDVRAGSFRACGHESVPGKSWCAHHLARLYATTSRITEAA